MSFTKNDADEQSLFGVRHLVLDVDGCILVNYESICLKGAMTLRSLFDELKKNKVAIRLCTGRGQEGIEMLLNFFGLLNDGEEHIAENGSFSVCYRGGKGKIIEPHSSIKNADDQNALYSSLLAVDGLAHRRGIFQEMSKRFSRSFQAKTRDGLLELFSLVQSELNKTFFGESFHVTHSSSAVDIVLKSIDKLSQLVSVIRRRNGDLKNVAFFGDSLPDLSVIEAVNEAGGVTGCPANAIDPVKETAQIVCSKEVLKGTIEFTQCIIDGKRKVKKKKK